MTLLLTFVGVAMIVGMLAVGWLWSQRALARVCAEFHRTAATMGYEPLLDERVVAEVSAAVAAIPGWRRRRIEAKAVAGRNVDGVTVRVVLFRSVGARISHRYVAALFSAPTLRLTPFEEHPAAGSDGGLSPRRVRIGAGPSSFLCARLVNVQPSAADMSTVETEGWFHFRARAFGSGPLPGAR